MLIINSLLSLIKEKMKHKFLVLLILILTAKVDNAATCTATVSGNWSNASTWSCPGGPACGDVIIIPAGFTVSISNQQDYSACTPTPGASPQIYVYGMLQFVTGNKLKLPCGSNVYIGATGTINPGGGSGNSNYIEICTNIVWNAADPPVTGPSALCSPTPCSTAPLAVEFIAFTAELEKKVVLVSWKTVSEKNNDHFEIQRSSDGINFFTIGNIPSKTKDGNSLGLLEYQFTDEDLKQPLYYYRLKQVDKNGIVDFSNSISVRIYSAEFNIFPNPNNGVFSIDVPSVKIHEEINIKIYNSIGELVHESTEVVKNNNITGSHVDVLPYKPLPSGVYLSNITFMGETHKLKLVVQ